MEENLTQFAGKTSEAESTLMPSSRAWIRRQIAEMGNGPEDHCVMLFLNCPAIGVISAARTSFILNYVTNVIADHPLNSVCFIVHPNRAGQQEGRRGGFKCNSIIHGTHVMPLPWHPGVYVGYVICSILYHLVLCHLMGYDGICSRILNSMQQYSTCTLCRIFIKNCIDH